MEYFDLFGLPVTLVVPQKELTSKYFELQKKFHPDFFSQSDVAEQNAMLQKSSLVNEAYKTLKDKDAVIKYVLLQKQLMQEEEKYQLPPDFLMEMLELNETLTEAKLNNDEELLASIETQIDEKEKEIYETVKSIIENYKEDISSEKELLQVKDYYYKKKYLKRILQGASA